MKKTEAYDRLKQIMECGNSGYELGLVSEAIEQLRYRDKLEILNDINKITDELFDKRIKAYKEGK